MSMRLLTCLSRARQLHLSTNRLWSARRLTRTLQPPVYSIVQKRTFADLDEQLKTNVKPPKESSIDKHEFKAETRQLLDIVARSLYSNHEVFVRELISNASDALEKFRYMLLSEQGSGKEYAKKDRALEIRIGTDKTQMQLTIADTGIGMTREEIINNLGTIARSGSKKFLEEIKNNSNSTNASSNIIGQFGVGFYSAFIVANKVELYTRSAIAGQPGYRWSTDGGGSYEIEEIPDLEYGTKIVLSLKTEFREYADEDRIRSIIKKYSNFVGAPILLNGKQANEIKPLWLTEPNQITPEQHRDFYRYIANTFDKPRFTLHYITDVPLSIHALFYFPENKPGMFEMSRDNNNGVALYTRKVLIQAKTDNLLPKWLRFLRGVVDSDDIPLNLSRELLQNSNLIKKLSSVLTNRILRFLQECAKKQPDEYMQFYRDYGLFLKEGIVTSRDSKERENLAKLLRFESSKTVDGKRTSLEEYCADIPKEQNDIYYLAAPNRTLAEASPYYEDLKKRNTLVLFCYEPYDELVLMQLGDFKNKKFISVEKEMRQESKTFTAQEYGENSLLRSEIDQLLPWLESKLKGKVSKVKATARLDTHPCVITVEEMAAARHFIRSQTHTIPEKNRLEFLKPELEINPKHIIIKKLYAIRDKDPELAELLTEQLFANAMVEAGLTEDPRIFMTNMNRLLSKALEKH